MSKPLMVTIQEEEDDLKEEGRTSDWTPRENRVLARFAEVRPTFGHISLTESERCDPTRMRLYVYFAKVEGKPGEEGELSVPVTATELDELIESLTALRDAAIAEWMLEPAL
ncbi:MAG: hypothetical protein ABIU86_12760 [Gemmatimonadaceae bacterium]